MTTVPAGPRAVLFDLLMAVMDSPAVWAVAAGNPAIGLRWRDAATDRMQQANRYVPYEALVAEAAAEVRLPSSAADRLGDAWREIRPRPDASALQDLDLPYAFVTNCSRSLARIAAARSGLVPRFTLSAEEAGWYKPRPEVYRLACERFGVAPGDALFVAGAAYDAEGARSAGLRSILVRRRAVPGSLHPGIAVVESLEEAMQTDR
jgi:2-haloalkanoic acid dehalogenase type II